MSYSSASSVEFYEENLKPCIASVKESNDIPLQDLADNAEAIIKGNFAGHPSSVYTRKKNFKEISVGLDKLMLAMVACAEEGEGERGKRYVAAAIVACFQQEDKIGALQALGATWLTHLLFIFKTHRGHGNQFGEISSSSGILTPTMDKPATDPLNGTNKRIGSFHDDVLLRDGYTCVVTGFEDFSHPSPSASNDVPMVRLVSAHILPKAICQFDKHFASTSYKSAVTTFDLLANFTHLPVKTLEELHARIDDADNRISLEINTRWAFDSFRWWLKQTETQHVYDLKTYKDRLIVLKKPENNRIAFKDHSKDFPSNSGNKMDRSMGLPDPLYIRIHATIAAVLNMSGAGTFFDELLNMYKDDEGNLPLVRSWSELEEVMERQSIKDAVTALFGLVKAQ